MNSESLEQQGLLTLVTLDRLRALLSAGQRAIVDQIVNLKPQDYGVDTPYAGDLELVPPDLVKVSGQQYTEHGEQKTLMDEVAVRSGKLEVRAPWGQDASVLRIEVSGKVGSGMITARPRRRPRPPRLPRRTFWQWLTRQPRPRPAIGR